MKALLYATDYSDNSVAALKFANELRKKFKCKLYVVHIFDISATFISTVSIAYARMQEAAFRDHRSRLLEFCVKHLGRDAQANGMEILIGEHSITSQGILDKAADIKPDYILVGTKGSSAVREFLLGSTASALIEKSEFPVLTIPPQFKDGQFKIIVYATAFEEADIIAVQHIVELANAFDSSLRLVHISTKNEYKGADQLAWFRELLNEKVAYTDSHIELRIADDVFGALNEYIDEVNPQLLVMLEREGHSLITNLWHRDLVKRMKLELDVPLLSFHKKYLLQKELSQ